MERTYYTSAAQRGYRKPEYESSQSPSERSVLYGSQEIKFAITDSQGTRLQCQSIHCGKILQWERGRKKEIMDIGNLNCGLAPSSKNNEIFFEISGILSGVNSPLLIILKIRSKSPYCRARKKLV